MQILRDLTRLRAGSLAFRPPGNLSFAPFFALFYRVPAKRVRKIGKGLNSHKVDLKIFFNKDFKMLIEHAGRMGASGGQGPGRPLTNRWPGI